MNKTLPLNDFMFARIMKNTKKQIHKLAFLLSYESGLRVSEVVSLKKSSFNLSKGVINFGKKEFLLPLSWKDDYLKYIPIHIGIRALQKAFKSKSNKAMLSNKLVFSSLRVGFMYNKLLNGFSIDQLNNYMGMSKTSLKIYKQNLRFIDNKKRLKILKRDNFKCKLCGRGSDETTLHIDHVVPLSKGGSSKTSNLQVLCRECNQGKGAKEMKKEVKKK